MALSDIELQDILSGLSEEQQKQCKRLISGCTPENVFRISG